MFCGNVCSVGLVLALIFDKGYALCWHMDVDTDNSSVAADALC